MDRSLLNLEGVGQLFFEVMGEGISRNDKRTRTSVLSGSESILSDSPEGGVYNDVEKEKSRNVCGKALGVEKYPQKIDEDLQPHGWLGS